jgi:hypothetical protein
MGARPIVARAGDDEIASSSTVDWKAIATAVGGPGQMMDGGVFLVDLARTDIKATAYGVPVQPDLANDGEAAFKQLGNTTMVMGELALLQKEVPSVVQGLRASGIAVSGLHNHLLEISPLIVFVHYSGMGDAMQLARAVRAALSGTKTPITTSATKKPPAIDIKGIQQVFGTAGQVEDEVFLVDVERNEQITMNGMVIPPAMGVQSSIYFQSMGGGKAASQAEFALLASEIDAVTSSLTQHGFTIAALHNHMTTIHPMLFWMHVWATGDAVTIAKGWKAALAHTNSKK